MPVANLTAIGQCPSFATFVPGTFGGCYRGGEPSERDERVFTSWEVVGNGFHRFGFTENVHATNITSVTVSARRDPSTLILFGTLPPANVIIYAYSKCVSFATGSFQWRYLGRCSLSDSFSMCTKLMPVSAGCKWNVKRILVGSSDAGAIQARWVRVKQQN